MLDGELSTTEDTEERRNSLVLRVPRVLRGGELSRAATLD